jgi:hypothetical protein
MRGRKEIPRLGKEKRMSIQPCTNYGVPQDRVGGGDIIEEVRDETESRLNSN